MRPSDGVRPKIGTRTGHPGSVPNLALPLFRDSNSFFGISNQMRVAFLTSNRELPTASIQTVYFLSDKPARVDCSSLNFPSAIPHNPLDLFFPYTASSRPTANCGLPTVHFAPLANLRCCLYPTRGGHCTTLDAQSFTGSSCRRLHPVRGFSFFHHLPRSGARSRSKTWRRRNGLPGRTGHAQSRAAHPT